MDIQQLANEAAKRINQGIDGYVLVMPRTKAKRYRYLLGRKTGYKSPRGEIIGDASDGGTIVRFEALEILAFAVAHGAEVDIVVV